MKVDFHSHQEDMEVLIFGSMGFSTEYIVKLTKLTFCQVIYRLYKAGIKRSDYRNGNSEVAATLIRQGKSKIKKMVLNTL